MGRLWLNGQTPVNSTSVASRQEIGTHVTMGVSGSITTLYYYRSSGGSANTDMRLWDGAGTLIEHVTVAAGSQSAQGWQPFPLATPHAVVAGDQLVVSVTWETGSSNERYDNPISPAGAADYPQWFEVFNATPGSFPTGSGYQGETRAVDLFVDVGTTPATPADVNTSLAAWLISTGDNTHQIDGLPWLTKTVVDAIKTIADNVPQDGGTSWADALKLWKIAGALTDAEIAAWNLFARRAPSQLTGGSGGGGSAFFTSDGRLTSDLVAQIYSSTTPARSLPPGTGWTLADETDWTDTLSWAVAAHCYLVTVSAWPSSQPATSSPAGTWLYRLGWWSILNGSLASGREWFEFAEQFLYAGGLKMPGVALFTKGGTTGHIQAWTIT